MCAHRAERGDPVCRNMIWSTVAEQHQIGNVVIPQELIEENRPVRESTAEIDGTTRPVQAVTAT